MTSRRISSRHKNNIKSPLIFSQTGVCILITAAMIFVTRLDTEFTNSFTSDVKNSLYYSVDIKASATELINTVRELKSDLKQQKLQ